MTISSNNLHNILGINERNLKYIRLHNPSNAKKIADDKLLTKRMLQENGIDTPQLLGRIASFKQLDTFKFSKLPGSVVVKPKHGFGGQGIIVFFSHDKHGNWLKADKTQYSERDLRNHIRGILEGNFSLKNRPDVAFFEERLLIHPDFKKLSYRGNPDIRIIVFNQVPLMAMLRLATRESDGKANLHTGGIGVGIDIESGITTYAVYRDKFIEEHPDNGISLKGLKIPYWNKMLELAVKSQTVTGIGYLGVDIIVDRLRGPLVLELNARPGLAIQTANQDGLKGRLERVTGLNIKSIERGIKVGKNLFGGEVEEEIEEVSGKMLIGYVENIKLISKNGYAKTVKARNDSGALWSAMDYDLAVELGYGDAMRDFEVFAASHPFSELKGGLKIKILAQRHFEDHEDITNILLVKQSSGLNLRPVIKISSVMSSFPFKGYYSIAYRKDKNLLYPVLIGRKQLNRFLIDPTAKFLG